jgi:hypothetical protein
MHRSLDALVATPDRILRHVPPPAIEDTAPAAAKGISLGTWQTCPRHTCTADSATDSILPPPAIVQTTPAAAATINQCNICSMRLPEEDMPAINSLGISLVHLADLSRHAGTADTTTESNKNVANNKLSSRTID